MRRIKSQKGFSLLELAVTVAILAVIAGGTMPLLEGAMQRAKASGAGDSLAGALRDARARAVATGWQYRTLGFNADGASAFRNQYRVMARSSGGVPWPADTAAPFDSPTQMAGPWINFTTRYPGVKLRPQDGSDQFWVAFDSRGVAFDISPGFNPLQVVGQTGGVKSLSVSTVGSVRVQ